MPKPRKPVAPSWSTRENRDPKRVAEILAILRHAYPAAHLLLEFSNPFQLLCATILAAQATDVGVNKVTPILFRLYPSAEELAAANFEEVSAIVHSTGFFRQKTERLIEVSSHLVERFDGEVPSSLSELTSLPGVGKKTAIIVLNHAFGIPSGVAVDTHVKRIAQRLDWSHQKDPDKMENDLREIIPRERWIEFQDLIAFLGRARCRPSRPLCRECPLSESCYAPERKGMAK